jgi:hypothetical protein
VETRKKWASVSEINAASTNTDTYWPQCEGQISVNKPTEPSNTNNATITPVTKSGVGWSGVCEGVDTITLVYSKWSIYFHCCEIRKQQVRLFLIRLQVTHTEILTEYISPWIRMGSGGIAPRIPNLGTMRRWVVSFTYPRAIPPEKEPTVPIGKGVGWTPGPVWTQWRGEKIPTPAETRNPMVYLP